jgi:phosphoribosylaminoimidazole (AIR) synthetase
MGIGFCVILAERDADAALMILKQHGRDARVIGYAVADRTKSVYLPQQRLIGTGKRFRLE